MARTFVWRSALLAALAAVAGCTERITTPGRCPELCPNLKTELADILITAADSADTTARGYVLMSEALFVAASSLDSLKSVILLRFSALSDTLRTTPGTVAGTRDTVRPAFPPDSVQGVLHVTYRDSSAHPRLVLYRLPARFDSALTYAQAQAYFADSSLLDTVAVPDTGTGTNVTVRLPTTFVPAPADSGVVAIGIKVIANAPTAVGLSTALGGSAPGLSYYVHGQPPFDTATGNLSVAPTFATFAQSPAPGLPPAGVLAVGGLPSAHSILHLQLPKVAVDSVGVVRGTLLLSIVRPVLAFPHDSFYVQARPLLRSNGPKSVLFPDTTFEGVATVRYGQTGTVELDIAPILRLWGTTAGDSLPRAISLSVVAEGTVLGELDFWGRSGAGGSPQLRVTYVKKYEFGVP